MTFFQTEINMSKSTWQYKIFQEAFDPMPHRCLLKIELLWQQWPHSPLDFLKHGAGGSGGGQSLSIDKGFLRGPRGNSVRASVIPYDVPFVVHSQGHLFADDCLMYQPIYSSNDQSARKRDLSSLERWSDAWGKKFNAKKCQIIIISRGRLPYANFYTWCRHNFDNISDAKYLRILVSNDLSWPPHIHSVCIHANSALGFLWQNLCWWPVPLKETPTSLLCIPLWSILPP